MVLYQNLKKQIHIILLGANATVWSWLVNSFTKDLQSSVIYFKTARDVWLDSQHRYSQGNGPRIF